MKKLYMLCFILPLTVLSYSQNINIEFNNPKQDGISGDTLVVSVTITSTYEISSVFATIEKAEIELDYTLNCGCYEGKIPLTVFNQDTLLLKVTATDLLNNVDSNFIDFIYDMPPTLELITPSSECFANPTLSVLANCYDEGSDSCYIKVSLNAGGTEIFRMESGKIKEIDLSQYLSHYTSVNLFFAAVDSRNQKSESIYYKVYISSNPYLKEVARMNYPISSFDGSNLLCLKPINDAIIYNLESMTTTNIYSGNTGFSYGKLSSDGIFFKKKNTDKLFKWKSDTLTEIASMDKDASFLVNEDYLVWTSRYAFDTLKILNLLTKMDTAIECRIPDLPYYVRDKGFCLTNRGIAYTADDYNIHLYKDGNDIQITFDDSKIKRNVYVQSDGNSFIYHKIPNTSNPYIEDFTFSMHDGENETILRDSRSTFSYKIEERINNGFIAFENTSKAGINQVYLIDTLKQIQQTSNFGTTSKLEYLNSDGEISFINNRDRYLSLNNGSQKNVGTPIGSLCYYENRWFVTIANTLLEIDTNAITHVLNNKYLNLPADTILRLSISDFTEELDGYGTAEKLSISVLPKNGIITVNKKEILVPLEIKIDTINSITYIPIAGFIGNDSILWNISTEYGYAKKDASLFLLIEPNTSSLQVSESSFDIKLYPNPVLNELSFSVPISASNEIDLRIYDMFGTTVFYSKNAKCATNNNCNGIIPVEKLVSGIYVFEISSSNFRATEIFIKN